jgi:hypothetical protein
LNFKIEFPWPPSYQFRKNPASSSYFHGALPQ